MHLRGPNGAGKSSLLRALRRTRADRLGRGVRARPRPAPSTASAVRREVGLLGHADLPLRRPHASRTTCASPLGRRSADRPASSGALDRLGLDGRLATTQVGKLSTGPAPAGARSPCSSPGARGSGCSTSRTPASTPRAASSRRADRRGRGRGVDGVFASHELDAGRVAIAGSRRGRVAGGRGRPRRRGSGSDATARRRVGRRRRAAMWRDATARRGQGPPDRAALQGRRSTRSCRSRWSSLLLFGLALGPDRRHGSCARRPPGCSGWPCCSPRCSACSAASRSRSPTTRRTACAFRASIPAGSSSARPAAIACPAARRSSSCSRSSRRSSTTRTPRRSGSCSSATCVARDARPRRGRDPLRRARARRTRVRETLLPLLFFPVVAPVLLGGDEGLAGGARRDARATAVGWLELLAVFAVAYLAIGTVAFGPLLEDA